VSAPADAGGPAFSDVDDLDDGLGPLEPLADEQPPPAEDDGSAGWRNPNPGHCRVCGDPVKAPRQYCDAHQHLKAGKHPPKRKPAASSSSGSAPSSGPAPARSSRTRARPTDRLAALEQDLTDQVAVASLVLQVGVPVTGRYLQTRSARIARDLTNIARRYPAVADYLTTASEGLVFLGIAEDGLGLVAALRVDIAKADPYGPVNRLTGVTRAYQDVIAERGLPDARAQYHDIKRAEAEAQRDEHVARAAQTAAGAGMVDLEDPAHVTAAV